MLQRIKVRTERGHKLAVVSTGVLSLGVNVFSLSGGKIIPWYS